MASVFLLLGLAASYTQSLSVRLKRLHGLLIDDSPEFIGQLRKMDSVYGFQHLGNARMTHVLTPGDSIQYITDRDGFRVPADEAS